MRRHLLGCELGERHDQHVMPFAGAIGRGAVDADLARAVFAFEDVGLEAGAVLAVRNAASSLNADFVSIGVESDAQLNLGKAGISLLPPGLIGKLIAHENVGAVLAGEASRALYPEAAHMQSVAVFRMRFGPRTPAALFAVGSRDERRFDGAGETREIAYFVRALEATIRAWLNPSKN